MNSLPAVILLRHQVRAARCGDHMANVCEEFYEMPVPILRLALAHLAKSGRAQVFKGTGAEDGDGVKFY